MEQKLKLIPENLYSKMKDNNECFHLSQENIENISSEFIKIITSGATVISWGIKLYTSLGIIHSMRMKDMLTKAKSSPLQNLCLQRYHTNVKNQRNQLK